MAVPSWDHRLATEQMEEFRAIKRHLDPQGLLNPGGVLGLDRNPEAES